MPSLYLMEPPAGHHRTEVNPPSSASAVIPAGVATTVIALIGVCLRLFTRKYVVKGVLGLDDYLCICALGFSVAHLVTSVHLFDVGGGLHQWDILFSLFSPAFPQTMIGTTLTFATSIAFSKLSVLTFYLRICPDRLFRRAVYSLIGLVSGYTVIYVILIVFNCRPVHAGWDKSVDGQCIGYMPPMMFLGVANIIVDFIILTLPIKIVLPLQIPTRQKVSLGLLFATGGMVCAVAIKRTVILPPMLESEDMTWKLPPQIIWSYIECNAGIICASVPALKPLCVRYIPFLIHSHPNSSQGKSSGNAYNEKQKKRNTMYSQSYELPSRDELYGAPRNDEEAQLWAHKKENFTESVDTKQDSDSFDSYDKIPARPPPVCFSSKRVQDVGGIHITKETYITIGP